MALRRLDADGVGVIAQLSAAPSDVTHSLQGQQLAFYVWQRNSQQFGDGGSDIDGPHFG
jgi:hypothetical protein